MPFLVFENNGPEKPVALGATSVTLGRAPNCTIPVPDPKLSREHCRIRRADDHYVIEDLGSHNGTLVNGAKIAGLHALAPGDTVVIGNTTFNYRLDVSNVSRRPVSEPATRVTPSDPATRVASASRPPARASSRASARVSPARAAGPSSSKRQAAASGGAQPFLKLRSAPDFVEPPAAIRLTKERYVFGRKAPADIILKYQGISTKHAELVREGRTYRVRDCGSTNGVYVNGDRMAEALLKPGDTLAIDQIVYVFGDASASRSRRTEQVPRLSVLAGGIDRKFIPVPGTITVGRKPGNAVVVRDDKDVSAQHVRFARTSAGVVVSDLGSTNGTLVNGERISGQVTLKPGDEVRFGDCRLVLEPAGGGSPAPAASASGRQARTREAAPPRPATRRRPEPVEALSNEDLEAIVNSETTEFLASAGAARRQGRRLPVIESTFVLLVAGVLWFALSQAPASSNGGQRAADLPVPAGSLLTGNHSFEREDEAEVGLPEGWFLIGDDEFDVYRRTTEEAQTGVACLEVKKGTNDYAFTDCVSDQWFPVTPGTTASASVFIRREGGPGGAGAVRLLFFATPDAPEALLALSSPLYTQEDWREATVSAVAPQGATGVRVACSAVGNKPTVRFDTATLSLARGGETPRALVARGAGFAWEVEVDGRARLREVADDRLLLDRVDLLLGTRAVEAGLASNLLASRSAGLADGGRSVSVTAALVEPYGTGAGTLGCRIRYGFDEAGQPEIVWQFAPGVRAPPLLGVTMVLLGLDLSRPVARYRGLGDSRELRFVPLVTSAPRTMPGIGRLVFAGAGGPLGLALRSSGKPATGSLRLATRKLAVAVRWLAMPRAAGNLAVTLQTDFQAAKLDELNARVADAVGRNALGDALVALSALVREQTYDPAAVQEAAARFGRIAARVQVMLDEFESGSGAPNLSPGRIRQTLERGEQIVASLRDADLDGLDLGDVANNPPAELRGALARILGSLGVLKRAPAVIQSFREGKAQQINALTLARWEAEAQPLLRRALDYEAAGLDHFAVAAYLELLNRAPLSRPGTLARQRVIELAKRQQSAAASARTEAKPALAAELDALALKFARLVEAAEYEPAMSATPEPAPFWDVGRPGFVPEARRMLENYLADTAARAPADAALRQSLPGDPAASWDITAWERAEATVRAAAEELVTALAGHIPPLPGE